MTERRIRSFIITPLALLDWARGEDIVAVKSDIPKTAQLRHTGIDPYTGNIMLALEDESFAIVRENEQIPCVDVRVERW